MNPQQYTGIARPIDFSYTTNKAIVVLAALALVAGLVMGAVQGLVFGKILWLGMQFGLTVFLTWAFAREVDPHQQYSAFAAVAFTVGGFLWGIRPDLLSVAVFMGAARVCNRSCGNRAKVVDLLMVTGGAAWLAFGQHRFMAVMAIGLLLVLDGVLSSPKRISIAFGAVTLAMGGIALYLYPPIPSISQALLDAKLAVVGLFALYMFLAFRRAEPLADNQTDTIKRQRLLALHIIVLLWVVLSVPLYGQGAINRQFIVWATMAGVSIFGFADAVFTKKA